MGVTYLLDTHVIVWIAGSGGPAIRPEVRAALEADDSARVVSAVSAFEIATKVRLGKFESARPLQDRWDAVVRTALSARVLPLDDRAARRAGELTWEHRDPFDRMLAAQAITEGLTLVTADRVFDSVPGLSLLPW